MGCSGYYSNIGPCANCGKENAAFMGSSAWGHDAMCCSNACGQRLAAKIRNGMLPDDSYDRILDLRIRIKQLERRAAPTPEQRG